VIVSGMVTVRLISQLFGCYEQQVNRSVVSREGFREPPDRHEPHAVHLPARAGHHGHPHHTTGARYAGLTRL